MRAPRERQRFASAGGKARAAALSPERRREIGRLAAAAKYGRTQQPQVAHNPRLPTRLDRQRAELTAGPDAPNLDAWSHAWRLARRSYTPGELDQLARRWRRLPEPVRAVVASDPERYLRDAVPLLSAITRA